MIVVSDTSCISNLLTINNVDLLAKLFGEVIIPPAVEKELQRFHPALPDFLKAVTPTQTTLVAALSGEVDTGEAEAICLARELKANRLLIDEKRGRAVAVREGVPVIGIVGILILAKEKKLVSSIGELMGRLEEEAGFRLSVEVKTAALRTAGEITGS